MSKKVQDLKPGVYPVTTALFKEGRDRLVVKTQDRGRVVLTKDDIEDKNYILTVTPGGKWIEETTEEVTEAKVELAKKEEKAAEAKKPKDPALAPKPTAEKRVSG